MKVGIITFHWAANYGAVLQTFALQKAIERMGVDVEIINYVPKRYDRKWWKCFISRNARNMLFKLREYRKGRKIHGNIDGKLHLSNRYFSAEELRKCPPQYDVYISGSDQIWNEFYTLSGEGKVTLSYFLDFAPSEATKISYATSIGASALSEKYWESALPQLKRYTSIGVREQSAKRILLEKGLNATVLPDPTLLIKSEEYGEIFEPKPKHTAYYILQRDQANIETLKNHLLESKVNNAIVDLNTVSLSEWGGYIATADFVLTNSYHGVIFSILFHRDFFAVLIEGELQGMNDRLITLLERLELTNRIIETIDDYEKVKKENIDWERVDILMDKYREEGILYLERYLLNRE